MTPEQTREFVELCKHPAIAGRQGRTTCNEDSEDWEKDWFEGDTFFYKGSVRTVISDNGPSISFVPMYQRRYADIPDSVHYGHHKPGEVVWLPQVDDYRHPERGLEGMLTGPIVLWSDDDKTSYTVRVFAEGASPSTEEFSGPLPIALAKARIWQSEQEAK